MQNNTRDDQAAVHSQLIPLNGENLILPNTAIAEIIFFAEPEALPAAPPWLLGRLSWRGQSIALVSFELAAGLSLPLLNPGVKIVVLNALGNSPGIEFFALVVQGLPRLLLIDESTIVSMEHESRLLILSRVSVNNHAAIIPDLDALEAMLLACKPLWVQHTGNVRARSAQAARAES